MFCKECGYQNEDGSKFCVNCGTSMTGVSKDNPKKYENPINGESSPKEKKIIRLSLNLKHSLMQPRVITNLLRVITRVSHISR